MKKQLIAAAVAAAVAAPMVASADVTVYGRLHYSVASVDFGDNVSSPLGTTVDPLTSGFDGTVISSHTSVFGIKGSEDLGNGLSLVFQMEFDVDGDDNGVNGDCQSEDCAVTASENNYVALAGSWGVAGVGRVDTPYKSSTGSLELFGDTYGDYEQLYMQDIQAPDALFYMSPNWNGFSFVAAVVAPSVNDTLDGIEATSISATYENGPLFATLAYESFSDDAANVLGVAEDKWRLGLGYTANGWHVGFIYEDQNDNGTVMDVEAWQLSASYTMGNNTIKAAYGEAENEVGYDADLFSIGLDHKLSNRTSLYVTHTQKDETNSDFDWDATAVGIIHTF